MDPFDLLNESVVRMDADGVIRGWNSASEKLYGKPSAEALGQRLQSLLEDEAEDWQTRLAETDLWDGEAVRTTAQGRALVSVRWAARRDETGALVEIIETGREADELRRLRKGMQENAFRYENLFQALAVAFFETDFRAVGTELKRLRSTGVTDLRAYMMANPDYVRGLMNIENILDANAAAVQLFAASTADDLRGSRSSRFWPDEAIKDYIAAIMAVMDKEAPFVRETRMAALDGSMIDVLFTVAWSPESAKRGIMVVGVIDLGDRNRAYAALQRSEAKYRNLFNAMSVGLLEFDFSRADTLLDEFRQAGVTDMAEHLLSDAKSMDAVLDAVSISGVNDRALELFNVDRPERIPTGMRWLWPPEAYPITARAVHGRYVKKTMPPADTRLRRLNGTEVDVTITLWAEPERRSDQPVLCAVVDITERIQARQRFDRLQAEFAHASRVSTLGELAASIAHEVSQPLSAIVINAEVGSRLLAAEAPLNQPLLASMNARTLGAARRATDILSRMRLAASPRPPAWETLSLALVASEALDFVRHELSHASIRCTQALATDLPPVSGDRIQLQQIVVNLVLNAAQALRDAQTPDPAIRLSTAIDGDAVVLRVEDNGPGFGPLEQSKLFDSFYTTKPEGMGMGLAVCRSIAEHHGGTITAFHRDPCGACFEVRLPIDIPADAPLSHP